MLLIQISKQPDASSVLRCTRADGSVTWPKQTCQAAHFALHDLTHYSVETTLHYTNGFFGLIAAGWEIDDTTGKGARGPLPPEALEVEKIVGLFDTERGSGVLWMLADFNQYAPRLLTDSAVAEVRHLRGVLFKEWFALGPGGTLELKFG